MSGHYDEMPNSQSDWEKQLRKSGREANCLRYCIGVLALLLSLASWQTMNEVISGLQEEYPKPYMVTWVLHCGYLVFFVVFLPILWFIQCCRGSPRTTFNFKDFLWAALFNLLIFSSDYFWVLALSGKNVLPALTSAIFNTVGVWVYILSLIFLKEILDLRKIISLVFCLLGVVFILISSLDAPSDNSNTTQDTFNYSSLCITNYSFDYKLDNSTNNYDWCFEPYANDTDATENLSQIGGYLAMCACSLLFAVYEVIFSGWEHKHEELLVKKYPHRKSDDSCARVVDTLQTVGLMGLANLTLMWIPMVILHFTGVEHFSLPLFRYLGSDECCWASTSNEMLLNAGLGAVYTSSFLVVVAMIGPFIASVGLILIIPIGFIVDYVMHHWVPSEETTLVLALQMAGCVAIVIGFAMLQWASKVTGKHRRRCGNAHKYCECIIW